MVQNHAASQTAGEDFYIRRNAHQVVRLARRESTTSTEPTGSYCCVIPTTGGEMTFYANIGKCTAHYGYRLLEIDVLLPSIIHSPLPKPHPFKKWADIQLLL